MKVKIDGIVHLVRSVDGRKWVETMCGIGIPQVLCEAYIDGDAHACGHCAMAVAYETSIGPIKNDTLERRAMIQILRMIGTR